jgi:hypothetical protein
MKNMAVNELNLKLVDIVRRKILEGMEKLGMHDLEDVAVAGLSPESPRAQAWAEDIACNAIQGAQGDLYDFGFQPRESTLADAFNWIRQAHAVFVRLARDKEKTETVNALMNALECMLHAASTVLNDIEGTQWDVAATRAVNMIASADLHLREALITANGDDTEDIVVKVKVPRVVADQLRGVSERCSMSSDQGNESIADEVANRR